jgi:hypothetical protein
MNAMAGMAYLVLHGIQLIKRGFIHLEYIMREPL